MTRHAVRAAALVAALALAHGSARARPLDPEAFASLGTLVLANGSFTIDTDAVQIRDGASTVLFTGVVDDQDGRADSTDDAVSGPLGIPEVAVFTFDSIDVQSTATIALTGSRALALLSRSDATIDALLDASGGNGAGAVAGAGRLGGFAGGAGAVNGVGPGAGGYTRGFGFVSGNRGGSGGFGGAGRIGGGPNADPVGAGGLPYGDSLDALQGGSGGGGFQEMSGSPNVGGGAGGGAIEVGALGAVVVGANATLRSRGGDAGSVGAILLHAGAGSAGGVSVHGTSLQRQGQVVAGGGAIAGAISGGGGRALFSGGVLDLADVAALDVPSLTANVDLAGMSSQPPGYGVLTFAPFLIVVGSGETRALEKTVLQAASGTVPGVEVVPAGVRVLGSGEVSVPAAGATHAAEIALSSEDATVAGPGVLTNAGRLAGPGRVEAPLANASGGRVEAIGGSMVFDAAVANALGARIDAIDATLDFTAGGLANSGVLRLVDATVAGAVVNAPGATPSVAGTTTFTGAVSGEASFSGPGAVVFAGTYAPGGSPALVSFAGDVVFAAGGTLALEIEDIAPGSGHDRIEVAGSATLGGTLDLDLGAFQPVAGQTFAVLAHGARAGEFDAIAGVQAPLGLDLAIAYGPGATTLTAVRRGDVDFDGDVDGDDVAIVAQNAGATTTAYGQGDVNGDGAVDALDEGIVVAAAATPIPALSQRGAALLALLLAAAALAAHRLRSRRA